jgi:heptosyltransferase-2
VKLLVIQTAFPGDVLLTVPLLHALRALPDVDRLAVLTTPDGAAILRTQSAADEHVVFDKRGRDAGPTGFLRVVRGLRALAPDAAVVPHRSFRSALLAFLAGADRRIGFDTSGGRALLSETVPYDRGRHEIERVLALAGPLGRAEDHGRARFHLTVPEEGRREAAERLRDAGLPEDVTVVAAAPGSRWATKRWPPERFAAALDGLTERLGARAVVTGTAADAGAARAVSAAAGTGVVDLTGRLSAAGWFALIDRAALLLSNDSAALHVAAGVGTPVVAVFGPTVPAQGYAPYADAGRVVEATVSCRPCGSHGSDRCPTGTFRCMLDVGVGEVVEAALELVGEERQDGGAS